MTEKRLEEAIEKLATGFSLSEVTEEFALDDGVMKLVKKKQIRKDVAPEIRAIAYLKEGDNLSFKSDEELLKEKERLEKELEKSDGEGREATDRGNS